jgi:hypothetical protein
VVLKAEACHQVFCEGDRIFTATLKEQQDILHRRSIPLPPPVIVFKVVLGNRRAGFDLQPTVKAARIPQPPDRLNIWNDQISRSLKYRQKVRRSSEPRAFRVHQRYRLTISRLCRQQAHTATRLCSPEGVVFSRWTLEEIAHPNEVLFAGERALARDLLVPQPIRAVKYVEEF